MLDDIMFFIKLYETQSFKNTATLLNIKPSTLSKHITALENKLGRQLIIRSPKMFKPTPYGTYVYSQLRHVSTFTEKILNGYNQHEKTHQEGVLNLSLGSAISYELISPHLDEFVQQNPNIQLNIDFSINIIKWPSESTHIVLAPRSINDKYLVNRFIRTEYLKLYCRREYALTYGIPLELEELVNHKIIGILNADNIPLDHIILKNLKNNNEHMLDISKAPIKINNPLHMRKIGLESNYICGSCDSLCVKDLESKTLIPILPEWHLYELEFYLVTKKNITPIEQAFIDFVYNCMSKRYNKMRSHI